MKRVVLVHGWGGSPEGDWLPWVKQELESRGYEVVAPEMPNTDEPEIESWVDRLKKVTGKANENTLLVAHSIGCQATLRYLETLSGEQKFAGVIFVAPWMELDENTIKEEGEEVRNIAKPWMETPIDFEKAKRFVEKFVAIFSDNDPYVPLEQELLFKELLSAQTEIVRNAGHFTTGDGFEQFPNLISRIEEF